MFDNDSMIAFGEVKTTDVSFGTSANHAYELYKEKKQKISELEYECKLLVEKYHSEMCHAHIPPQFRKDIISDMFGKDTDIAYKARNHFLKLVFSEEFLKKHRIVFEEPLWYGYERTSVSIILNILDSNNYYSVEIPLPNNITTEKTKTYLMGQLKFRANRILKSKGKDFIKKWEAVQTPTYDWKACFEAIEAHVAKEEGRCSEGGRHIKIKRYHPSFVEGFDDEYADVLTKEELLKVPFVSTWAEESRFEEFCIDGRLLVAFLRKSNGERAWYVVASFVEGAEEAAKWFNKPRYIR